MTKAEIIALTIVLLISLGAPAGIYYYEFEYRPAILLGPVEAGSEVRRFVVNVIEWNLTEVTVNRGDIVKLVLRDPATHGFYVENYTQKQPVSGSAMVQFVANVTGTYSLMLSTMELECHCWISSPYEEVGKLVVQERQTA